MGVNDDGGDLIKRQSPDLRPVFLDDQKSTLSPQMATIRSDVYDLLQNASSNLGRMRFGADSLKRR